MAWITIAKYLDHQPLYRQEQMSARWGARIPRQTMVEWIAVVADWLRPICQRMHRELLAGGYVQCDETPIRCQDPDAPGQTVQGWLWGVSHPQGNVVFQWRKSRRQGEAASLFSGFKGVLQSDAYTAYAAFAHDTEGVIGVGCWTHARRRFHGTLETAPVQAGFVLRLIGSLYAMEAQWDRTGQTGPVLRASRRQSDFAPTCSLLVSVRRDTSSTSIAIIAPRERRRAPMRDLISMLRLRAER